MKLMKISIALLGVFVLFFGCARRVSPVGEVYVTPRPIDVEEEKPAEEGEKVEEEIEVGEEPSPYGYHVQVYAFLNQNYAEGARSTLENQFSERIYVVRLHPYYKVRIGNFKTRKGANRVKRKAVDLGYWDAFVVSPGAR